jgi:hypothetical protein
MPNGGNEPPHVHAQAAADAARQSARLAANQLERLLALLAGRGVITDEEALWIRSAPR